MDSSPDDEGSKLSGGAAGTVLFVVFALAGRPALAHGSVPAGWHDAGGPWSADPLASTPLIVSSGLYALGAWRLRRRLGRFSAGFGTREILLFGLGTAALVVALLSPLEGLAGALLSAHMVQHILLVTIAPPLLVLGKPEVAWLRSLPDPWRRSLPRVSAARSLFTLLGPCGQPVPAAIIHMTALWLWHSPSLFNAALASDWLHWLEHLTFFGTALLFWRAVIKAGAGREAAAGALIACFITLLQSGLLSALLSFAREPLYRVSDTVAWGLTPLEDQQLAGAIMSIPMCIVYLAAGLAMAYRILTPRVSERAARFQVSTPGTLKSGP